MSTVPIYPAQLRRKLLNGPRPERNTRGTNPANVAHEEDPSRIATINLVTRDYPAGNGSGPPVEFGKAAKDLNSGLARIYDQKAWQTSGSLVPKQREYPTRYGISPYFGNDPGPLPALGLPVPGAFRGTDVGRQVRSVIDDKMKWPDILKKSPLGSAATGASLGAGLAGGASMLHGWLNPDGATDNGMVGGLGALLGGLLGYNRTRG